FSASVSLTPYQFDLIKSDIVERESQKRSFPPLLTLKNDNKIKKLEMEALALELELELLNFAA
ncbi:MAG: hypothetical protein M3Q97_09870, partial [Bacteroidota bacterium]|nr:hypothetical protein [Bacteroidota bacterium]